jgi:imidazole glycerol-phosphate synthase subunit HisH
MITIVNYGMGNLGSILNMFKRVGAAARIESDPQEIAKSSKLMLPGVGAFDAAMQCINTTPGLLEVLHHKAMVEKIPVLGVCLGMQLLTEASDEGELKGLGWIPGRACRFPAMDGLKVPHMGWNVAHPVNQQHPLMRDVGDEPRYYFVHSYCVQVTQPEHSLMRAHYGIDFDAAIARDNIMGAQFHPEKSHRFGMRLLSNFAAL